MRETSTIFQVSFKHRLLGGKHAQLADAVITGMSTEGYKAAYLRMDDEGNIAHTNPMRIFCGKASAEDFTYTPGDALSYQSTLQDDAAAIAEVAEKIHQAASRHKILDFDIQTLSYTNGALTHLDGVPVVEIAAKHAKHAKH